MSETTEAAGQVDTTAETQGTDAATTDAGQATLLGDAGTDQAAGAAPAEGESKDAGDKGESTTEAEGGKKADEGQGKDNKSNGAPAEYADFTAPEGMTMHPESMGELKAMAKELNITQEKAQQLADLGAKLVQRTQAAHQEQVQAQVAQWVDSSRNDKEFGGEKLAENLAGARAALDQFGTPELKTMLEESGLGNNPEVIRLLHRVNKAVSEDAFVRGKAGEAGKTIAQRMYPGMNP